MRGIRISTISLFFCLAGAAATPDYFPLQQGNQWVFRCGGTCTSDPQVLEIERLGEFNGNRYALLKGFHGRETWLRLDETGVLWAYDPGSGRESRWYSFFAPEGEKFETSAEPCSPIASVATRAARYRGPVGEFENALAVTFEPGACADAGLGQELFLPWIGLIQRTEMTIAGPRTWDLIYSHTGGVTVLAEPHLSVSLTLDKAVYSEDFMPPVDPNRPRPLMTARLSLRNTTTAPVKLVFPTGQRYDIEIRNEKGEVVYRWSDGKAFPMLFGEEAFGPGERNYVVAVRLGDKDGKPLEPGRYVVEASLTTAAPRVYSSTAAFELTRTY